MKLANLKLAHSLLETKKMQKPILSALVLLILCSCNSPEARLGRLQHTFWEKFARQDYYDVKLEKQTLHWPLPPISGTGEPQKQAAEKLQQEANAIEKDKLNAQDQKQLAQICAALEDCVANAGSPMFDPSRCTVSAPLQQFAGQAELSVLLGKIPDYYAQIEQRWRMPDSRFVSKAVEESQNTLDLLQELEAKMGAAQVAKARAAVKDFIGLCQSALLR